MILTIVVAKGTVAVTKAGHGSTFSDLGWVRSGDFLSGLGWVNPWVKSMGQTHGSKGKNIFWLLVQRNKVILPFLLLNFCKRKLEKIF